MKKGVKLAAVALLFLSGAESVLASPFSRGFGGQGMRGPRQPRAAQQERQAAPPAPDQRGAAPAPAGVPAQPIVPNGSFAPAGAFGTPAEQPRRMGQRMTPEERRALRRQINEAGHDIYGQKK